MTHKIAFLFLIYDKIEQEELWYTFFNSDHSNADKYSIYIHYKTDTPLKYFEQYKLNNCTDTQWGHISIVNAQNLLLETALKDLNNQHFVFCSGACIPVKSFSYIYTYLKANESYFNICPDAHCFPRCNQTLKYINKKFIKKSSQWCILNRKHAKIIINSDKPYLDWFKTTIGDEHCYISYLYYLGLENEIKNIVTTFTLWLKNHRRIYVKTHSSLSNDDLKYFTTTKNLLFARKFTSDCDVSALQKFYFLIDETAAM